MFKKKKFSKLFFTASTIKLDFIIPNNRFMKSPTSFLNFKAMKSATELDALIFSKRFFLILNSVFNKQNELTLC